MSTTTLARLIRCARISLLSADTRLSHEFGEPGLGTRLSAPTRLRVLPDWMIFSASGSACNSFLGWRYPTRGAKKVTSDNVSGILARR